MLKQLFRSALMVALLAAISASFSAAQAAPPDLDPTFAGFGNQGIVREGRFASAGMALQPNGKIVIVSEVGDGAITVLRYLPNGQPDTTFGGNGRATIPAPPGLYINPQDVAVQADGRIVVAGRNTRIDAGNSDFLLICLFASGRLDTSFGNQGFVLTDFFNDRNVARKVLILPDGKIVAAGATYDYVEGNVVNGFAVARYHPDGKLDVTFNGDGKVRIPFYFTGESYTQYFDMTLQSDGKLVVVGAAKVGGDYDFAIARLNGNGTPDTSFDGDGRLTTGFGGDEAATGVAILADGRIVVAGHKIAPGPDTSFLARYLTNGKLDNSLDGDGKLTIPNEVLQNLALQPDGKLVLSGYTVQDKKIAIHRLLPGGGHDTTFNAGGIGWYGPPGTTAYDTDLALLPDGRILAMESTITPGVTFDTTLVRVWPNGYPDQGGQQTHGLAFPPGYQPGYRESAHSMAVQPNGAFLVAGQVYAPNNAYSYAFVSRFTPGGLPDPSFGVNSIRIIGPGLFNRANAVAVQPDGKIVIAGYSAFNAEYTLMDFLVARFHPNGAPDTSFGANGYTLVNFPANGPDAGLGLAPAPDGKIVVAGTVWTGVTYAWGVVRLTSAGQPDPTFGTNGLAINLSGNDARAGAVVVQPDRKIVLGGHYNKDFLLVRLLENGSPDPSFGTNGGYTLTDMGGSDGIAALALAPNGWLYAAGTRGKNGNIDMALAQYTPAGLLAACPDPANCQNWPTGTFFVNEGINDYAYALDLRGDNQLVAAGCINNHFAGVQVRTDGKPSPLLFNTDFVGNVDCANAVRFSGADTIVMAGYQDLSPFSSDWNIALARFETTVNTPGPTPNPTLGPVYLPIIVR
jgi:uncharacterized delta-60 repeat protein